MFFTDSLELGNKKLQDMPVATNKMSISKIKCENGEVINHFFNTDLIKDIGTGFEINIEKLPDDFWVQCSYEFDEFYTS
jgi:hypothetical protein